MSQELYKKHIIPYKDASKITVTFPDLFSSIPGRVSRIAVPMRIQLLKIVEHNPTLQILTPNEIKFDVPNEYLTQLELNLKVYDSRRICLIFVEDLPVLIDYSENSNWKNGPIHNIIEQRGKDAIKAVIKFHYDNSSSEGCPIKVFPFLFPGPNDYRDFPEFREEETYQEKHDVFSRITYEPKYAEQFLESYHQDKFKYSITAYWGSPTKRYAQRKRYAKLSEQIKGSNIVTHNIFKSVSMNEYYENLSQSKFGIAIRGSAKYTHREMELSSIGLPWFAEDRQQSFYKPLIPGEHYIAVTPEDFLDVFEYYNEHYDEAVRIGLNSRTYFGQWHRQTGLQFIFKEICQEILSRNFTGSV